MDIPRAFTFPFRDPVWPRKVAIGIALMLVPIVGWLWVAGYGMRVTREVAAQRDRPLPEWDDWGDLFGGGLRFFGVLIVWCLLPAVALCPLFAVAGAAGISLFDATNAAWSLVFGVVIAALYGVPLNAALARAAVAQDAMEGINVPGVLGTLRRGIRGFVVATVVMVIVSNVTGYLGGSDPTQPFLFDGVAGWAATGVMFAIWTFYSALYNGHLTGQAYWLAEARGGQVQTA